MTSPLFTVNDYKASFNAGKWNRTTSVLVDLSFFFRKTLFLWQALFLSSNSLITEKEELAKGANEKPKSLQLQLFFLSDNFTLTFCEWIVSEGRASIFLQLGSGRCWCAGPHLGHFHTSTLPPHFHTSTKARTPNPPFSISARTSSYLPPLHSYRGKHFSCFRHSPRFLLCSGGSQWAGSLHLFANMRKPIKPSIVAWLTGTSLFLSWEIDLPQASPSPPSSIDNFDRTGGKKETSQVVRLNVPSLM